MELFSFSFSSDIDWRKDSHFSDDVSASALLFILSLFQITWVMNVVANECKCVYVANCEDKLRKLVVN